MPACPACCPAFLPALRGPALHPRNRHQSHYDFPALTAACPDLAGVVRDNAYGDPSIDFADPQAVRLLNQALLQAWYGVQGWTIPPDYLCPPIPGRADYVHELADLLAQDFRERLPVGPGVTGLDVGVGANLVYPLVAVGEFGWTLAGSDTDPVALANAAAILAANPAMAARITLRAQTDPALAFAGVIEPGTYLDFTLCNPPFHATLADAAAGSQRKWQNLGRDDQAGAAPTLNFGGKAAELCCDGGEVGFISRMIRESQTYRGQCLWFTSLVSRQTNLPLLREVLAEVAVAESQELVMTQGQKQSRVLAWTWLKPKVRRDWAAARWTAKRG